MKIVLLAGNLPHHIALAEKISRQHTLAGIVLETRRSSFSFQKKFISLSDRFLFREINDAWKTLMAYYRKNFRLPQTDILHVHDINDKKTIDFIMQHQPDLLVVSGTSIIRKDIVTLHLPKGIVNLHTGLSPYCKQ
jgi:methionyl-tRNA formyltransferase